MAIVSGQITVNTMNIPIDNTIYPPVEVYFKLARTTQTRMYMLYPNWTISDFKNIIKSRIYQDFNVMQHELVETGQYMPGVDSEDMPALQTTHETLVSKYGPRLEISFYIRPIYQNITPTPIIPNNTTAIIQATSTHTCSMPFCGERITANSQYFDCPHPFCDTCIAGCVQTGHSRCPCCRHES
jgi:hypothetical protein